MRLEKLTMCHYSNFSRNVSTIENEFLKILCPSKSNPRIFHSVHNTRVRFPVVVALEAHRNMVQVQHF